MTALALSRTGALVRVRPDDTEHSIDLRRAEAQVRELQAALVTLIQGDLKDCEPDLCDVCAAARDVIRRIQIERHGIEAAGREGER